MDGRPRVSGSRYYKPGFANYPPMLDDKVNWNVDLFADFVVCAFEPQRPGIMQPVCIDSASNIAVRTRRRRSRLTGD